MEHTGLGVQPSLRLSCLHGPDGTPRKLWSQPSPKPHKCVFRHDVTTADMPPGVGGDSITPHVTEGSATFPDLSLTATHFVTLGSASSELVQLERRGWSVAHTLHNSTMAAQSGDCAAGGVGHHPSCSLIHSF